MQLSIGDFQGRVVFRHAGCMQGRKNRIVTTLVGLRYLSAIDERNRQQDLRLLWPLGGT